MNRYKPYLDEKPKPPKKTSAEVAAQVAAYLATGKKISQVPRGVTGWSPLTPPPPEKEDY